MIQGCIFFIAPKIWSISLLGKKYDDLLRQYANVRRKRWKNGGKGKIFTAPWGKNQSGKRGAEKKYPILGKYTPLASKPLAHLRM